MMFLHMTNHVVTENCVTANKKNRHFIDIELSAGLDVAMTEFQTSVITRCGDQRSDQLITRRQG